MTYLAISNVYSQKNFTKRATSDSSNDSIFIYNQSIFSKSEHMLERRHVCCFAMEISIFAQINTGMKSRIIIRSARYWRIVVSWQILYFADVFTLVYTERSKFSITAMTRFDTQTLLFNSRCTYAKFTWFVERKETKRCGL